MTKTKQCERFFNLFSPRQVLDVICCKGSYLLNSILADIEVIGILIFICLVIFPLILYGLWNLIWFYFDQ